MKDETKASQSRETGASVDELVGLGIVEPLIANSVIDVIKQRAIELSDDESIVEASPLELAGLVMRGLANVTEELSVDTLAEAIEKQRQFSETE